MNIEKFFGDKGISRSEANHLSNVANKSAEFLIKELKNINFIQSSFKNNGEIMILNNATPYLDKLDISSKLTQIGYYYGFVAWIREALKQGTAYEYYLNSNLDELLTKEEKDEEDMLYNKLNELNSPNIIKIDDEDVVNDWSTKQHSEYLLNEALASHVGKFIHADSHFENILNNLIKLEPTTFKKVGDLNLVISNTQNVETEDFKEFIDELRNMHRNFEKKVNRDKALIKDMVSQTNIQNSESYRKNLNDYNDKVNNLKQKLVVLQNIKNQRLIEKKMEFSLKKIIVPLVFDQLIEELKQL